MTRVIDKLNKNSSPSKYPLLGSFVLHFLNALFDWFPSSKKYLIGLFFVILFVISTRKSPQLKYSIFHVQLDIEAGERKSLGLFTKDDPYDLIKPKTVKIESDDAPKSIADDSFKEVIAETIRILKGEKKKLPKTNPKPTAERFFDVGLQVASDLEMDTKSGITGSTINAESSSSLRDSYDKWYRFAPKAHQFREEGAECPVNLDAGRINSKHETSMHSGHSSPVDESIISPVHFERQCPSSLSKMRNFGSRSPSPITGKLGNLPKIENGTKILQKSSTRNSIPESKPLSLDVSEMEILSDRVLDRPTCAVRNVSGKRIFSSGDYGSPTVNELDTEATKFFNDLIPIPPLFPTTLVVESAKSRNLHLSDSKLVLTSEQELKTLQLLEEITQEALSFYLLLGPFTKCACVFSVGNHCLTHTSNQLDKGQISFYEEIYATCGRPLLLQSDVDKLLMTTVQSLAKSVGKSDDINQKHFKGHTNLASVFGQFLYMNYHHWYESIEDQSRGVASARNKCKKRRWIENALLCLTLSGFSAALSDVARIGLRDFRRTETNDKLAETVKVLLAHWNDRSPSWLVENLRRALIQLPRPSPNWYIGVIDIPHVPRIVLSRILQRLSTLSLGCGVSDSGRNTVQSTNTDRSYVDDVLTILLLRMRLTANTLYPSKPMERAIDLGCMRRAVDEICPPCSQYNSDKLFIATSFGSYTPLASDLHRFLHAKYRLWEMELECFVSNCPEHLAHTLFAAFNPAAVYRLQILANHKQRCRLFLLGRIMYALYFEPNALTTVTEKRDLPEVFCSRYNCSPDLRFENCSLVGHFTLRTHSSTLAYMKYCINELALVLWLLTGLCPTQAIDRDVSNDRPSQLWITALYYKELIIRLLFGSDSDHKVDARRIRQALMVLVAQNPTAHPITNVWLPRHRFCISTNPDMFILSRMFICKVVDVIRKCNEGSTKPNTRTALHFARTLKITLPSSATRLSFCWLLRQVELRRDAIYGTSNVAGQLMKIWCQTTADWNYDDLSLHSTEKTFLGNICRPFKRIAESSAVCCEHDLALMEPSFMFLLVALSDKEDFCTNKIKSLLCPHFWPYPAGKSVPMEKTKKSPVVNTFVEQVMGSGVCVTHKTTCKNLHIEGRGLFCHHFLVLLYSYTILP